jgi:hypothetical protein
VDRENAMKEKDIQIRGETKERGSRDSFKLHQERDRMYLRFFSIKRPFNE